MHITSVGQIVQFLLYILILNRYSHLYSFMDNVYSTVELLA